jgi:hypothetical protein
LLAVDSSATRLAPDSRTGLRIACSNVMRTALITVALLSGCYHYKFEQSVTKEPVETYKVRVPTYVNGLVGTGKVNTAEYCPKPVRTELRVETLDVLISIATLLIYTPHTLYITCPAPNGIATSSLW